MRNSVLILFLGLLYGLGVFAQSNLGGFSNYNINNGLSQSSVLSIFQDKKGFIWLGTSDGLNRFDGKKFTIFKNKYTNPKSLSDSWVMAIISEDRNNNLWVLTSDYVFNKFNLRTFESTRFSISPTGSNPSKIFKNVYSFVADTFDNMWVSTNIGLFRFNNSDNSITNFTEKFIGKNSHEYSRTWVFSDQSGCLWLGSNDMLCKYNFKADSFIYYSINGRGLQGLPKGKIFVPAKTNDSYFWVLTDKGLCMYNNINNRFILYPYPEKLNISYDMKLSGLLNDKHENIWIGTNNGLVRFDKKAGTYSLYQNLPGNPKSLSDNKVTKVFETQNGHIWVGTANGLCKYNPLSQDFDIFKHKYPNTGYNQVAEIFELSNNEVWIFSGYMAEHGGPISKVNSTEKCLERLNADPCNKNAVQTATFLVPKTDKTGNLWLGTFGDGVIKYSPRKSNFKHYQNLSGSKEVYSSVWGFTEDAGGNIWIALFDNGFSRFDTVNKTFKHYKPTVTDKGKVLNYTVTAISADKYDNLWIATVGAGLMYFDPKKNTLRNYLVDNNYYSLSSNFIRSMYLSGDGKLYLCHAQSGIDIYDTQKGDFKKMQHNPENPNSLPGNSVWAVLPDSRGNIWVSMEGYISCINTQTGKYTNFEIGIKGKYGFPADKALCITESSKGVIWFGTSGGGICKFDSATNRFITYSEDEGLINGVVYGMLEDAAGNLWLSTNRGLSRFNPTLQQFTNFDVSAGLQSNEFNSGAYFKSRDNRMYFGGINGFNVFDPLQITSDTISATVVLTDFLINNKPVHILGQKPKINNKSPEASELLRDSTGYTLSQSITYLESIAIPYNVKTFTIEFAALLFNSPEKCTYRYKMEGFEDDWNYSDIRNHATYTNLPHGGYVFKVQAANPDGFWGRNTAEIKVVIIPPFYKTWWFIALMVFLILLSIRIYIVYRERNLRKLKALLEEKVKQRTSLIEEKKEELRLRNIEISRQKEEIAFQAKQLKSELVHQNQTSEIALLRTQINPHFLFNTLNNIYSLVYQKSDDAPIAVMKLSEIMRYMLYDAVSDKVPLEKEINYLKSFIELQVLRIKNRECVDFAITGNIFGKMVAPMLFIPFVENAFKHGIKKSDNPCIIINLAINEQHIFFNIVNQYQPGNTSTKDQTGGIGLVNVRRRLELLYPNKHKLDIDGADGKYQVTLELTLHEN